MSWFRYDYAVYQAEYSRNLLFRSGGQMEDLFGRILDRTRSRLDIPTLRTLFGLKNRPHSNRAAGPPAQEAVIEKSQYGLTWFKVAFGRLQLKACTKGEHVLRFEATVRAGRRPLSDRLAVPGREGLVPAANLGAVMLTAAVPAYQAHPAGRVRAPGPAGPVIPARSAPFAAHPAIPPPS
jgi:hypothetical protein